MGCGSSKTAAERAAERRSRDIDKMHEEDVEKEREKVKLLLLGAGESGKSTIFKQFKIMFGTGFQEDARKELSTAVYSNVIVNCQTLIAGAEEFGHEMKCDAAVEAMKAADEYTAEVDSVMAAHVSALWADPGIQKTFAEKSRLQLGDSTEYFLTSIDRIGAAGYIPSVEDVLKTRIRTTGIISDSYLINGTTFDVFDVGGQRSERKKWIFCFDDVTAVIFVAALSEYDQMLFEDHSSNRMMEALRLFDEVCNCKWFEETTMILFLNKRDLFESKIAKKDIKHTDPKGKVLFEDYDGGCDYDKGLEYLTQQFLSKNKNPAKAIYPHATCATDRKNVETVFDACKDTIFENNVRGSAFM